MKILLLCLLCLQLNYGYGQEYKNVLFVGNSLTYYHDMPQTLQHMLDEQGVKIKVDQSTAPGKTLSDHLIRVQAANGNWGRAVDTQVAPTVRKITDSKWNIVILQEGVTSLVPEAEKFDYESAIIKLDSIIKTKGAATVLYQTYAENAYPKTAMFSR